jgi:hypothetical protein
MEGKNGIGTIDNATTWINPTIIMLLELLFFFFGGV